jgi:hypothetical protein
LDISSCVDLIMFVTTGLDPVVHAGLPTTWIAGPGPAMTNCHPSCPALCRASTSLRRGKKDVDGRAKPGHDDIRRAR